MIVAAAYALVGIFFVGVALSDEDGKRPALSVWLGSSLIFFFWPIFLVLALGIGVGRFLERKRK